MIIVGRTEGLWWEFRRSSDSFRENVFCSSFHAHTCPKAPARGRSEFRASWNLSRRRRDRWIERRERYGDSVNGWRRSLRQRCLRTSGKPSHRIQARLAASLLLPGISVVRYLLSPLAGTNITRRPVFRRYRFDMGRTVWPSCQLYETPAT